MPTTADPITVKVKRLHTDAQLPMRMTEGAACFDIATIRDESIPPLSSSQLIHTGLAFELPRGYHIKVFLRSSTGRNTKLRLANQTGILDSDYRGELNLIVENIGKHLINIPRGTRIAQFLIERDIPVTFEETDTLTETARGAAPSGSTGDTLHGSV